MATKLRKASFESRVIAEHIGVRLVKPDNATKSRVLKRARENDRKGSWISDEKARPKKY